MSRTKKCIRFKDQCLGCHYWELCHCCLFWWEVAELYHASTDPADISLSLWGCLIIACLSACPLIHSGLDRQCKVQRVCWFISAADTGSGGSVFILVRDTVFVHKCWVILKNTGVGAGSWSSCNRGRKEALVISAPSLSRICHGIQSMSHCNVCGWDQRCPVAEMKGKGAPMPVSSYFLLLV